jgi:hypothetical protein
MKAIADAHDTGNLVLLGFLYNAQLLNGIIIDKPDMGVSIKELHG